jgi:tetratricopeptide (TPR) repeat protein
LRINAKSDDGKDLVKHYHVNGFPTVLFLTMQGNEIDRICGFDGNKDNYLKIIQDYAAGQNTLKDLLEKYNRDTLNIVSNHRLAKKYIDRWESSKAQKYLNTVLKLDVEDNYGFREESELQIAIYAVAYSDKKDVLPLITFLNKSQQKEFLKSGYNQLILFYRNEKDTIQYFKTLDQALKKLKDNTHLMNEYAWAIFTCKLQAKYKYGIELAEEAVKLEPDAADIWDTLAWLYYADGDHQKAISAMKKAAEINSDYHENLQKLSAEINKKI